MKNLRAGAVLSLVCVRRQLGREVCSLEERREEGEGRRGGGGGAVELHAATKLCSPQSVSLRAPRTSSPLTRHRGVPYTPRDALVGLGLPFGRRYS